jgi:hypothetical protein
MTFCTLHFYFLFLVEHNDSMYKTRWTVEPCPSVRFSNARHNNIIIEYFRILETSLNAKSLSDVHNWRRRQINIIILY